MSNRIKIILLLIPLTVVSLKAQIVIDSLSYEITMYGDVVLRWTPPQGTYVAKYSIYRGTSFGNMKLLAEIYSPIARQYTDHHSNVIAGSRYIYGLEVQDTQGRMGFRQVEVTVISPPSGLRFTSRPPTTAYVGSDYFYFPQVDVSRPEDVEYSFGGRRPDGMELNTIAGGLITLLYWNPMKAGQYNVTLVATHKNTKAFGVQEFSIKVATKPGVVRGFVRSVTNKPVPNSTVRIFQVADAISYETITDSLGMFSLDNVQAGEIFAYAKPPTDQYLPQWYSLGQTLKDVPSRVLQANDTLVYEFYLLSSLNQPTTVAGAVTEKTSGNPVANATVAFIEKTRFIHIGDTTLVSNPGIIERFKIDTSVATGPDGKYSIDLRTGKDYYIYVQKSGYLTSFNPVHPTAITTNAMESRPVRIREGLILNYSLESQTITTENRIVGTVSNAENAVNKQAIVILIDPDLKRGASGGHTFRRYRSTVSDENGYYSFDNLPFQTTYSVLAIPLEKGLAPQYFSTSGGTSIMSESKDIVNPTGTVQDIDFALRPTKTTGVGTVYGQVTESKGGVTTPIIGTLLFAENSLTRDVVGYAISDSTGWYSIAGLPPGEYIVHADAPSYGSLVSSPILLDYKSYNLFSAVKVYHFVYAITSINPLAIPDEIQLHQNYPNPFNPSTTIVFGIPQRENVTLKVLNALGQEVRILVSEALQAGTHTMTFDSADLPSGMYYYQLQSSRKILTRKMILMK